MTLLKGSDMTDILHRPVTDEPPLPDASPDDDEPSDLLDDDTSEPLGDLDDDDDSNAAYPKGDLDPL